MGEFVELNKGFAALDTQYIRLIQCPGNPSLVWQWRKRYPHGEQCIATYCRLINPLSAHIPEYSLLELELQPSSQEPILELSLIGPEPNEVIAEYGRFASGLKDCCLADEIRTIRCIKEHIARSKLEGLPILPGSRYAAYLREIQDSIFSNIVHADLKNPGFCVLTTSES